MRNLLRYYLAGLALLATAGLFTASGPRAVVAGPAVAARPKLSSLISRTVLVDAHGRGDYSTLAAAAAYVTTQSPGPSDAWLILVAPGIYTVTAPLTLPQYTAVEGLLPMALQTTDSVQIQAASNLTSGPLISCGGHNHFSRLTISATMDAAATAECQLISGICRIDESHLKATNSSASQVYRVVRGIPTIADTLFEVNGANSTCLAVDSGGFAEIRNTLFTHGPGLYTTEVISGTLNLRGCRFNTGGLVTAEVKQTGGTLLVDDCSGIVTTSGTITWRDKQQGRLWLQTGSTPGTPASGGWLYVDSATGKLRFKGSSGTVTDLASP